MIFGEIKVAVYAEAILCDLPNDFTVEMCSGTMAVWIVAHTLKSEVIL